MPVPVPATVPATVLPPRLLALMLALLPLASCSREPPPADRWTPRVVAPVSDYAKLLDKKTRQRFDKQIRRHQRLHGTQIAVLLLPSCYGEPIEKLSLRAALRWSGGRKGVDDGVLVTLCIRDRKSRIELGTGVQQRLRGRAKRLLVAARPALRAKRWAVAVAGLVAGVMRATSVDEAAGRAYRVGAALRVGLCMFGSFALLVLLVTALVVARAPTAVTVTLALVAVIGAALGAQSYWQPQRPPPLFLLAPVLTGAVLALFPLLLGLHASRRRGPLTRLTGAVVALPAGALIALVSAIAYYRLALTQSPMKSAEIWGLFIGGAPALFASMLVVWLPERYGTRLDRWGEAIFGDWGKVEPPAAPTPGPPPTDTPAEEDQTTGSPSGSAAKRRAAPPARPARKPQRKPSRGRYEIDYGSSSSSSSSWDGGGGDFDGGGASDDW